MSEQVTPTEPIEPTPPVEPAEPTPPRPASGSSFYKSKIADMEATNAKLKADMEAMQTAQLQEKENFKELWELEKTKREQAEEKATNISTSYFNGLKMSAIEQEAIKLGIRETALADISMIDNSLVQVETTSTGNANVLGAKEFVEQLKESRAHWFTDQTAPIVNNANPGLPPAAKEMTGAELVALEKTDKAAYQAEMKRRLGKS